MVVNLAAFLTNKTAQLLNASICKGKYYKPAGHLNRKWNFGVTAEASFSLASFLHGGTFASVMTCTSNHVSKWMRQRKNFSCKKNR